MFQRIMVVALLVGCILGLSHAHVSAYVFGGLPISSTNSVGGLTYKITWNLSGSVSPGNPSFLANIYTLQKAALACVSPTSKDIRTGQGFVTPITIDPIVVSHSESSFLFPAQQTAVVNEHILTSVAEFAAACNPTGPPDFTCGQTAFQNFYKSGGQPIDQTDCQSNKFAVPTEVMWGDHFAEGTTLSQCTDPTDPSTCRRVDDHAKVFCTTPVAFKDYTKVGIIDFTCTCIEGCQ